MVGLIAGFALGFGLACVDSIRVNVLSGLKQVRDLYRKQ